MTDSLHAEILRQVTLRGADKSICPSEVARAVHQGDGWQRLMGPVRDAARSLAQAGRIDILRKGQPVDPTGTVRGVIRLRLRTPGT